MTACRLFPLFAIAWLGTCSLRAAQTQSEIQPQKQADTGKHESGLKLIKSPPTPFPEKELKKIGQGKVVLRIAVDAKGRVSDAEALSGPPELFPAAIENVKHWEFEPPAHAPVVTTVEISYGHPRECPGAISDFASVEVSGRLLNKNAELAGVSDGNDYPMPPYFDEDRKVGIAGEMILSLRLDAEGKVKKIRVVKSLSLRLDQAAMETFRKWRFKLNDENPGALQKEYQLRIRYQAMCHMRPGLSSLPQRPGNPVAVKRQQHGLRRMERTPMNTKLDPGISCRRFLTSTGLATTGRKPHGPTANLKAMAPTQSEPPFLVTQLA